MRIWRYRANASLLAAAAILAAAGSAPARAGTLGFVVTHLAFANHENDPADCPDGLNASAKDIYLQGLPDAERARLSRPENQKELWALLYAPGGNLGPGKRTHNRCADPADFQSPPLKTVQGKIADGMSLEGRDLPRGAASHPVCAHEAFTSPDGQPGVDNQLWRVMGCIRGWKHGADIEKYAHDNIRAGEYTVLIDVNGVKDDRADGDVEVGLYSSDDQAAIDPAGNVLPDASLQVADDPKYRTIVHGRLAGGVITTDPVDLRLHYRSAGYVDTDFYLRAGRLRLELQPDGSAKGMLGGYYDVETLYDGFIRQPQVVTSVLLSYSCPAVYSALNQYADGYPDPKTGKCTAISTALRIEAIPAFVIHPKAGGTKTADAAGVR
jgi:hypothetical protein